MFKVKVRISIRICFLQVSWLAYVSQIPSNCAEFKKSSWKLRSASNVLLLTNITNAKLCLLFYFHVPFARRQPMCNIWRRQLLLMVQTGIVWNRNRFEIKHVGEATNMSTYKSTCQRRCIIGLNRTSAGCQVSDAPVSNCLGLSHLSWLTRIDGQMD